MVGCFCPYRLAGRLGAVCGKRLGEQLLRGLTQVTGLPHQGRDLYRVATGRDHYDLGPSQLPNEETTPELPRSGRSGSSAATSAFSGTAAAWMGRPAVARR